MANYFDKYDTQAATPASSTGNYFDRYDAPSTPRQPAANAGQSRFDEGGGTLQSILDSSLGIGQGITLGWGDEIYAGMLSPIEAIAGGQISGAYDRALEKVRGLNKEAQERSPVSYGAGNVAGGAMIPLGAGANAATLPGRMGRGIIAGGTVGGVAGAGEGEGVAGKAGGAVTGALVGGSVGAVAPPLIEGGLQVARTVTAPIRNAIRGATNTEAEAARRVGVAIERDVRADPGAATRLTPQEFAANAQAGGPATVMDLGGEATRSLARSAANTSQEGRGALNQTINDRFEGQSDRVTGWLRGAFHYPDAAAQTRALQQTAQAVNRPAYARAYSDPAGASLWDEGFQQLTAAPVVQDAIRSATRTGANKAAVEGFRPPRNPFQFAEDGTMTLREGMTPSLQFWDAVKRNLDDKIASLQRSGEREAARDAQALRASLVDRLDEIVPSYQQARAGAAHFFRAENALEAGQNYVMQNFANAETRRALAAMSQQERQLFQDGFVSRFIETIERSGDRRNVINQIAGSPAAREKLNIALGPQRAAELEARLRVEGIMDLARGAVQGNSTTARQLAEIGLAGGAGTLGAYGTFNLDPAQMTTAAVMGALLAGRRNIDQRVAQRVATMLTSQDPQVVTRGLQMVARNNRMLDNIRATDRRISATIAQQSAPADKQPAAERGIQPEPQIVAP